MQAFSGHVILRMGVTVAPVVGFLGTVRILKVINITIGLKAREEEEDTGRCGAGGVCIIIRPCYRPTVFFI